MFCLLFCAFFENSKLAWWCLECSEVKTNDKWKDAVNCKVSASKDGVV